MGKNKKKGKTGHLKSNVTSHLRKERHKRKKAKSSSKVVEARGTMKREGHKGEN